MTTKVQTENEKILAAMIGQKNARRATAKERATSQPSQPLPGTEGPESIKSLMVLTPAKRRRRTPEEKIAAGRAKVALPPEEIPAYGETTEDIIRETDAVLREAGREDLTITPRETPMTEPKTAKAPRVLDDPVDNAKLIRMRAKWNAERVERRVARAEEAVETAEVGSPAAKEAAKSLRILQKELDAARAVERKAYKAYRDLLEAKPKKAAKTASSTAEAAVADPEDLDATINAQRESR